MNTSEYNASLASGEKPVGSGAGAPQSSQSNDVTNEKSYNSHGEFTAAMKTRRPPVFKGGNSGAHAAMSEIIGEGISQAEEPNEGGTGPLTPESQNESGLAWEDSWDKAGGATRQYDPNDRFAPFREGQGVPLEIPSSVMNFSEADESNLTDFSFVAAREGWSKEFAQSLVDQAAADFRNEKSRPGPEGYDPHRTVSELRWEFGAETEAILARVEAYCARRPALSAYLDSTGLGNSPSVLRMLAAVSSDESIVTREGAKRFVDGLSKNEAYWSGSKLEVAKSRIAFMLVDGK